MLEKAFVTPGCRVEFAYDATTAGHGDFDEKGAQIQKRVVVPVDWVYNCKKRMFLAADKRKYRVSGIDGVLIVHEAEEEEDASAKDKSSE